MAMFVSKSSFKTRREVDEAFGGNVFGIQETEHGWAVFYSADEAEQFASLLKCNTDILWCEETGEFHTPQWLTDELIRRIHEGSIGEDVSFKEFLLEATGKNGHCQWV